MPIGLAASARFVVPAPTASAASSSKLLLFDVMDTLVADPFFRGFHKACIDPMSCLLRTKNTWGCG